MGIFASPAASLQRLFFGCVFGIVLACHPAWAQPSLPSLFESSRLLSLPEPMRMATVPVAAYPPGEVTPLVLQKAIFSPWQQGMALPTSSQQDVWLRLALPVTASAQAWMLRIPRGFLEQATLFQASSTGNNAWQTQEAGLNLPNSSWPMRTHEPVFALSTRSDQIQIVFLRLQNSQPVTENIQLIHSADFADGASRVGVLHGLILGVFIILTLISGISAFTHRSAHFAWFALLCFSMLLSQLTVAGFMTIRVWSDSVYLAKAMGWVLPLLTLAALARFSLVVSYAKDLSTPIFMALWLLIAASLVLALGVLVFPTGFPRLLLNVFYAAGMALIFGSLAWIAWRSQYWLWQVAASIVPLMLTVLARLAYNLGWVAHVELALLAGVITASLGLILIYAALLLHQRERHSLSQRERALETRDAATGLFTEQIALARLPQLILRSTRFERPCGAILVRWLDFDRVMQSGTATDRGRIFSHLGNRLNRLARDIDTVSRVGDDLFLFLVEAPVRREDLNALASHIISTCMRSSAMMPDNTGFDLHLAIWISTDIDMTATDVMDLLKTRITQMREGSQRRVQFVDAPMSPASALETLPPAQAQLLVQKINTLEATQGLPSIKLPPRKSLDSPRQANEV